ncbi:MAG TPA: hypothetical protein VH589_01920 [Trebonia sp.]
MRDFLDRFRPAGSPGAAARSGVPADRSRQLAAEVGPVLALLDESDAERARIVEQARRDAEQVMAAARAEAAAIAADAQRRAQAAREAAEREVLGAARAEAAAAVAAAIRQAAAIRELAGQRMPSLVDQAVGLIWQLRADDR